MWRIFSFSLQANRRHNLATSTWTARWGNLSIPRRQIFQFFPTNLLNLCRQIFQFFPDKSFKSSPTNLSNIFRQIFQIFSDKSFKSLPTNPPISPTNPLNFSLQCEIDTDLDFRAVFPKWKLFSSLSWSICPKSFLQILDFYDNHDIWHFLSSAGWLDPTPHLLWYFIVPHCVNTTLWHMGPTPHFIVPFYCDTFHCATLCQHHIVVQVHGSNTTFYCAILLWHFIASQDSFAVLCSF